MTNKDLAVFLVAGVIGAWGHPWSGRVSWGIVGIWALLKLLKVV